MANWQFGITDFIDIVVVAVVVYFFLHLIRGTRAVQMLIGIGIVVITYQLAQVFGLFTVEWMFGHFFSAFMVILVVLFQQEIRRALMRVAIINPLSGNTEPVHGIIDAMVESSFSLVHRGWGGLIVIERDTGLKHLFESGVSMDAPLQPDVIQSLFCPDAPMHDGAVMVGIDERGGRVLAARVLLPLAQSNAVAGQFGTRHRAAVGISEESDALVIVVSEETGNVHLVEEGKLGSPLDSQALHHALQQGLFSPNINNSTADTHSAEVK